MAAADVNGDKLTDIFVGGVKENPGKLYLQTASGTFTPSSSFNFKEDFSCTDGDALFFDADKDGDMDLYIASGGYHDYLRNDKALQDRLYLNNGAGRFTRQADALPQMLNSKSCVRAADIDKDGDHGAFCRRTGYARRISCCRSKAIYLTVTGQVITEILPRLFFRNCLLPVWLPMRPGSISIKTTWPDLIITGEFMPIRVFINEKGKKFTEATKSWFDTSEGGLWNKIAVADFDRDGNMDLIAGNFGTNSQLKSSAN